MASQHAANVSGGDSAGAGQAGGRNRMVSTAASFYVEARPVKVDLTEGTQVILTSGVNRWRSDCCRRAGEAAQRQPRDSAAGHESEWSARGESEPRGYRSGATAAGQREMQQNSGQQPAVRAAREASSHESVKAIYPPAGGHLASDGGHFACGLGRVSAASGLGAAAGGLSDDPGDDVLSGR